MKLANFTRFIIPKALSDSVGSLQSKGSAMSTAAGTSTAGSVENLLIPNNQPFTILVEGNIASGKTRLLDAMKCRHDILTLTEPVDQWRAVPLTNQHTTTNYNVFELMYTDPSRWALTFQTYVQLTMLKAHLATTKHPQEFKLMERSLFSARHCFVENLRQNVIFERLKVQRDGSLSVFSSIMPDAEYAVLNEWYKWICENIPLRTDLIVYLRSSPEICHQRLVQRCRPEEKPVKLDYLQSLHELHEQRLMEGNSLLAPCQSCPVLVLDANQPAANMTIQYQKLMQYLDRSKMSDSGNASSELTDDHENCAPQANDIFAIN